MHKSALVLLKNCNIRPALGALLLDPQPPAVKVLARRADAPPLKIPGYATGPDCPLLSVLKKYVHVYCIMLGDLFFIN